MWNTTFIHINTKCYCHGITVNTYFHVELLLECSDIQLYVRISPGEKTLLRRRNIKNIIMFPLGLVKTDVMNKATR